MILLDTGVIIDYLRTADVKLASLFGSLPCGVCGAVRAELLHGVRSAKNRIQTLAFINGFHPVATPESLWDTIGDHLYTLRINGITVPFVDAVLVGVAIANDLELWTRDAHFSMIQRVLPSLKLFAEPP